MELAGFLRELRRRHVYRVAAAYAIASWIIIQIAVTTFPYLGLPQWMIRLVIIIALFGFPWALVLSWAYDFTHKGIVRTADQNGSTLHAPRTYMVAVAAIGLGLAGLEAAAYWYYSTHMPHPTGQHGSAESQPINPKSIAVLPFENLSADPDNVYFTAGIQDEILTNLAHIHDLKVISRTSTEKYKAHPEDLRKVSRELGVKNILEGSVQKIGDQVRVNVQLIDATEDNHIWAEIYDEILKDIFAVESTIARKIADALKATLLPQEAQAISRVPVNDPATYNDFLKAEYFFRAGANTGDAESNRIAIDLYKKVVRQDPTVALAWAHMSIAMSRLYWWGIARTQEQLAAAKDAANQALTLQSDLADSHLAMGYYDYWGHMDYPAALDEFKRAQQILPNDADTLAAIGYIYRRTGKWTDALTYLRKASELDPRNAHRFVNVGETYLFTTHYPEAIQGFRKALELAPDNGQASAELVVAYLLKGDIANAHKILDGVPKDAKGAIYVYQWRLVVAQLSRKYDELIRLIEEAPPSFFEITEMPKDAWLGLAYTYAGRSEKAKVALGEARSQLEMQTQKDPNNALLISSLGLVNAALGRTEDALKAGNRAVELLPPSKDAFNGPVSLDNLAKIYALLGHGTKAALTLKKLLSLPAQAQESRALIRMDPVWDKIRDNPAFKALGR